MELDGASIVELVGHGDYEKALGVGCGAGREEVNRAHVRLLYRFRRNAHVREALNRAKCQLAREDDARRGRRLFRLMRHAEALPFLRRAARSRGRLVDHHWLGTVLFSMERYAEAVEPLERAVDLGHDVLDEEMLVMCHAILRREQRTSLVQSLVALARGLRESLVKP